MNQKSNKYPVQSSNHVKKKKDRENSGWQEFKDDVSFSILKKEEEKSPFKEIELEKGKNLMKQIETIKESYGSINKLMSPAGYWKKENNSNKCSPTEYNEEKESCVNMTRPHMQNIKKKAVSSAYLDNSNKGYTPSLIKKHFPSAVREWNNSIYSYNPKSTISLPVIGNMVIKLLKSYFNAYFSEKGKGKYAGVLGGKSITDSGYQIPKKLSVKDKIYVSRPEIKHTNSKVMITIYKYGSRVKYDIKPINDWQNKHLEDFYSSNRWNLELQNKIELEEVYNKNIYYLSDLIYKLYNKKIEFRVIDLQYLHLNTSILVEYLANKLTNRKRILQKYRNLLKKIKLPLYNKYNQVYKFNRNALSKFSILNNLSYVSVVNLNLKRIEEKGSSDSYSLITPAFEGGTEDLAIEKRLLLNQILTLIKYKSLVGIKFEIGGRLTRRNIAAKSVVKVGQKGTLKNIDASYKQLSVVTLRGLIRPNLDYASFNSKTRNGSFNVKGWTSHYYSTFASTNKGTFSNNINLNPHYVTGFTDGEGGGAVSWSRSLKALLINKVGRFHLHFK